MELTKELWGKTSCGKEIYLYTLKNESGAYVQLSNIGAGVVSELTEYLTALKKRVWIP